MKHFLLLFCFCSAMAFAQTNQSADPASVQPIPSSENRASTHDDGPLLRHLKEHNATDWARTRRAAAKTADGTGKAIAIVAVIPAIPVYFVALFFHCSFHDCVA